MSDTELLYQSIMADYRVIGFATRGKTGVYFYAKCSGVEKLYGLLALSAAKEFREALNYYSNPEELHKWLDDFVAALRNRPIKPKLEPEVLPRNV